MQIRIVKVNLQETNEHLEKIANALELMLASQGIYMDRSMLEDQPAGDVMYTNDDDEIKRAIAKKLGKEHLMHKIGLTDD